jgi:hypothetical protein
MFVTQRKWKMWTHFTMCLCNVKVKIKNRALSNEEFKNKMHWKFSNMYLVIFINFLKSISHWNLQVFTSVFSQITCLSIFIKWHINICDQQYMENYKIYNSIIIIITWILTSVNCESLEFSKVCHLTMLHLSNVPLLLLQKKF